MEVSSSLKTLADWQDYIFSAHSKFIDMTLERTAMVAKRMGLDKWAIPVITVAGTNGKGSTIKCLETIYTQANYKVGCYTSPHLLEFNERFSVCLSPSSDACIVDALTAIEQAREDISLTFYEYSLLAALYIFKQADLDVLLLEVGLGGRLDGTNIIDADVAVITSIGLDHMQYLGDTREAIAIEKGGILRPEAGFICGDPSPPKTLLELAHEKKVHGRWIGADYSYKGSVDHWQWRGQIWKLDGIEELSIKRQNASTALAACEYLSERLPLGELDLARVISTVTLPGRFQQVYSAGINWILDVAHNEDSVSYLSRQLLRQPKKRFAVFFNIRR